MLKFQLPLKMTKDVREKSYLHEVHRPFADQNAIHHIDFEGMLLCYLPSLTRHLKQPVQVVYDIPWT